jgi:hypothetical protein
VVLAMKRILTLTLLALLLIAVIRGVNANAPVHIYRYSYAGVEVAIENPYEIYPEQNITVNVAMKALVNLTVSWMRMEMYTFHNLTTEETLFHNISHISTPTSLFGGQWLNKTYEVLIPDFAANVLYGKMVLKWTINGTEETTTYERKLTFIMGYLKNVELENLKNEVERLENENAQLKENLTVLLNNLTEIRNRYEGELNGTRSTVAVLAITTVFFLATTAYLVLRKPKQYW